MQKLAKRESFILTTDEVKKDFHARIVKLNYSYLNLQKKKIQQNNKRRPTFLTDGTQVNQIDSDNLKNNRKDSKIIGFNIK